MGLPHIISHDFVAVSFWALVSNLFFLKFRVFKFSILEFFGGEHIFENYVGEISRNK